MTPLLLAVQDAPVPFMGSDGQTSSGLRTGDDQLLERGNRGRKSRSDQRRRHPANTRHRRCCRTPSARRSARFRGTLAKGTLALFFLDVTLAPGAKVPADLTHRVSLRVSAAPPGHQEFSETGGATTVDRQPVASIGPPLRGTHYISADSCCDATRHTRAALPVNGRVWVSQRYAVDWEQTDAGGRIYAGPREKLESYAIFGQPVLAVADALVVSVIDGEPEQTPGKYPTNIALDKADGNASSSISALTAMPSMPTCSRGASKCAVVRKFTWAR